MQRFHLLTRSYVTFSLLTLALVAGLAGMALADQPPVDLNAATAKQLEQLSGVGKELAQRIVEYRTANGPFKRVDDILKVKGIGKGTLAKVQDLVMIGHATPAPPSP